MGRRLIKFDKERPKVECPSCCHGKTLRLYVGYDSPYGKCDRLNNCGHHQIPPKDTMPTTERKDITPKEIVQLFVPNAEADRVLHNDHSPFHNWATSLGVPLTHLRRWGVGASDDGKKTLIIMRGADGAVWNQKTIIYGEDGKRKGGIGSLKQPKVESDSSNCYKYFMPLYGVNLLRPIAERIPVCIVESEKTAIIAAHFYPQYDWVAVSSCAGLTAEKAAELTGRTAINVRDCDMAGRSTCTPKKAETCQTPLRCFACRVPMIEKALAKAGIEHCYIDLAPDKTDGYDLADLIAELVAEGRLNDLPSLPDLLRASEATKPTTASGEQADGENLDENLDELECIRLGLPNMGALISVRQFGFYEHRNCYYFLTEKGPKQMSNFTMEVLFFIPGTNGKRIMRLTNEHGTKKIVEFELRELTSLQEFNLRIEGVGHFLFYGGNAQLVRIKNKIYAAEAEAAIIPQPGMFERKLWAWANGVFRDGKFYPTNEFGMVELPSPATPTEPNAAPKNEWYYLPFMQQDRYENERYMRHIERENPVGFDTWARLFAIVYGNEKAIIAIGFALIAAYRDIILQAAACTPILFLSGQKSSGKGSMANSLLHLFGQPAPQFMLGGKSTTVGMMRTLAQRQNAIVWFDEYKNAIDHRIIESLKNIWDGIGTLQGQKSNDNSTKATKVLSAAIVSGQDVPVGEPAFLSRLILLTFKANPKFSAQQVANYEALRVMERGGLTHLVHKLWDLRGHIEAQFPSVYAESSALLKMSLRDKYSSIEERQYVNYAILMAVLQIVGKYVALPVSNGNIFEMVYAMMVAQNRFAGTANEVQQFWSVVAFLMQSRSILENRDYLYKDNYIIVRMTMIYPLYREASRRQDLRPMDIGTLDSYLRDCDTYAPNMTKDATTGRQRSYCFSAFGTNNRTTGIAFDWEKIEAIYGIDLPNCRPPSMNDTTTVSYGGPAKTTETTGNAGLEFGNTQSSAADENISVF